MLKLGLRAQDIKVELKKVAPCAAQAVNAANAGRLPILLASKALPEMEAEDAGLLWAHRDAAGGAPVGEQYEALGVRARGESLFRLYC
jgi:hypothetical protein